MMVESEAKELTEDEMLGAVMFAHDEIRKVIGAIIDLAEQAAKEPWELSTVSDNTADMKAKLQGSDRRRHRGCLQADRQVGPLERAQRSARQGQGCIRR